MDVWRRREDGAENERGTYGGRSSDRSFFFHFFSFFLFIFPASELKRDRRKEIRRKGGKMMDVF